MKKPVYIVVAADQNNGIGKNGKLPWHLSKELKYFANLTRSTNDPEKRNLVIMGRKTWESIPEKYRPLPARDNIVLTTNKSYQAEGAEISDSLDHALNSASEHIENIFIIGGAEVFRRAIDDLALTGIYLTKIHHQYDCDTFLQPLPERFKNTEKLGEDEEMGIKFEYMKIS